MNYTNYRVIQVMKRSEKAEVAFAAVDELDQPVVAKRLFEANPEIYRVIAGLRNRHIPQIYAVEEKNGEILIIEEYVDGRTLDTYLKEEVVSDAQKVALMLQLCDALTVLHGCEPPIIHRDIKPSNLLVTDEGVLKIIDYDASRQYKHAKDTGDTRLLGTIEYAAPEQFGYAQTDFRSDIYSAGVVFSQIKLDEKAVFGKDWKRLVDKCTSFDPENRYKDVPELKRDLEKCMRKATSSGKKRWVIPVVATVVLFIMLLTGRLQMQRDQGEFREAGQKPTAVSEAENSITKAAEPTLVPERTATQEQTLNPESTKTPEPTETSEPTSMPESTPTPEPTLTPIPTPPPVYSEAERIVLVEDRFIVNENTMPVMVEVREGAPYGIKTVYICSLADENDPYSEMIELVETNLYLIAEDGGTLRLDKAFFNTYNERQEIVLYLEFEDGRGERVWLTRAEESA